MRPLPSNDDATLSPPFTVTSFDSAAVQEGQPAASASQIQLLSRSEPAPNQESVSEADTVREILPQHEPAQSEVVSEGRTREESAERSASADGASQERSSTDTAGVEVVTVPMLKFQQVTV